MNFKKASSYQFISNSSHCIFSEDDKGRHLAFQARKKNTDKNPEFWGSFIWPVCWEKLAFQHFLLCSASQAKSNRLTEGSCLQCQLLPSSALCGETACFRFFSRPQSNCLQGVLKDNHCCRVQVWVSWAIQQISIGHLFYIRQCKFPSYSFHTSHPLLPSPQVHKSILYVCFSTAALKINSLVPFF